MNEETAEEILQATLKEYRRRSYEALTHLVGQNDVCEVGALHRRCSVKGAAYPGSSRWHF
jgi:hypothetical protein